MLRTALGLTLLLQLAGAANAVDIADYTAFPPFLPRVVSPNILFMLDYSASMVRPAYGTCSGDWQNCRYKFFNPKNDYDPSAKYSGYYDGAYSYACSPGYSGSAMCEKSTAADSFNGNWLNWLAMTQFDVLKKVVVGGDVTAPPETGNPTKLQSQLDNNSDTTAATFREFYKVVSAADCLSYAPDSLCGTANPQRLPYAWIETPDTADFLYGKTIRVDDAAINRALPFPFNYFGSAYTRINLSENGYIQFTNAVESVFGDWSNDDIPSTGSPNNLVAVLWDDLVLSAAADSYMAMFTVGTSPNRIAVITWEQVYPWSNTTTGGVSFQVLLFEDSNQIVFQYKDVDGALGTYTPSAPDQPNNTDKGRSATIGLENSTGTLGKKYSAFGSTLLENNLALHMTHGYKIFTVLPGSSKIPGTNSNFSETLFYPQGTTTDYFRVFIDIKNDNSCPTGFYLNKTNGKCYDHVTEGLLQEFRDGELAGLLGFRLGIMQLNDQDGGKVVKHFNEKDANGWSSLMAATRGQRPTAEAPLAEALHMAQGYFRQDTTYNLGISQSGSSWTNDGTSAACNFTGNNYDPFCFQSAASKVSCVKSYALLVSSGNYSHDFANNIYNTTALGSDKVPLESAMRQTLGEIDAGRKKSKNYGGLLDNVAYQMRAPSFTPPDLRSDIEGNQTVNLYAVNTFGAGSGDGTSILKRAALYGGFKDENGDGAYNSEDTNGNCVLDAGEDLNGNGILDAEDNCADPKTYFEASGGGDLRAKIVSAVTDILKNSASGTSVSVLSTSAGGEGALYQAYFYPAKIENQKEDRKWPGFMRAFFLDRYQNLRDDNSSASGSGTPDGRLVLNEDRVAQMWLDTNTNEVKVDLFYDSDGVLPASPTINETVQMDQVPSVWEAGKSLAFMNKANRNIYLWHDLDHDGVVDDGDFTTFSGEAVEFTTSAATTLRPYLRATDVAEAEKIISFIRGAEVSGYRSRCITVAGASQETGCPGSNQRVWPLGDIIYSTPTLVAAPGEKFDQIYGEASYRSFSSIYKNRRQRVFVGANDGMLHAFNAGVYNAGDDSTTTSQTETGWFTASPTSGNGWGSVGLGDELWSFIPYDNLPHLAWLACNGTATDPTVCGDSEYTHVYYVDHRPKVTDARIFSYSDPDGVTANDFSGITGQPGGAVHTRGWGTILILPMRFGGGAINVDLNGDGDTLDAGEQSFRSAYYAFDITDPEKKPKLLWRFTHSALGFATSYPGIVRVVTGSTVKWFMVVGSGPTNTASVRDYGTNNTSQTGKIFVVDLSDGTLVRTFDTGVANAVMGDPTVVDADVDFSADTIYIGSAISTTSGRAFRISTRKNVDPGAWVLSTLFDPVPGTAASTIDADPDAGKDLGPLLVGPSVSKDISGNLWVFFGTGRLRGAADINNSDLQRFYGIKDRCWQDTTLAAGCDTVLADNYSYKLSDLLNSSGVSVTATAGSATQVADSAVSATACGGSPNCSYQTLLTQARNRKGWYVDLSNPTDPMPSERVLSRSSVLGGLVLFTTYQPTNDICSVLGDSYLYALYYETGTAYNKPVVGTYIQGGTEYIKRSTSLGQGMPTSVGVAIGETVSGFVQKSTGEIVRVETAPGLGVRSGAASWREKAGRGGSIGIETIYKHIVK
jgi:type IV pilus assembly protein PilY1